MPAALAENRKVVAAYTGQVTAAAVADCLGGVALGNVPAVPVLGQTASVYQVGALRVPPWADLAVPVTICAVAAIAAMLRARFGPASIWSGACTATRGSRPVSTPGHGGDQPGLLRQLQQHAPGV